MLGVPLFFVSYLATYSVDQTYPDWDSNYLARPYLSQFIQKARLGVR